MSEMSDLDDTLSRLSKSIKIKKPTEQELEEGHKQFMRWQIENPNNLSFWSPKIAPHLIEKGIKYPTTRIIAVPVKIMEACFLDHKEDYEIVRQWVRTTLMPQLFGATFPIFMKNGCFSNKFDFAGSCMLRGYDKQAITDNFVNLQNTSLAFETGGNMEIILRQFIEPPKGTPTIYHGMPLRPELRLFYDFAKHSYCYAVNYWDWDYCHDAICDASAEDKKVYESCYAELKELYEYRKSYFLPRILAGLRRVDKLAGIWSLDFILDEHVCWFIDAAIAERSAYWDEDWLEKGLDRL